MEKWGAPQVIGALRDLEARLPNHQQRTDLTTPLAVDKEKAKILLGRIDWEEALRVLARREDFIQILEARNWNFVAYGKHNPEGSCYPVLYGALPTSIWLEIAEKHGQTLEALQSILEEGHTGGQKNPTALLGSALSLLSQTYRSPQNLQEAEQVLSEIMLGLTADMDKESNEDKEKLQGILKGLPANFLSVPTDKPYQTLVDILGKIFFDSAAHAEAFLAKTASQGAEAP